MPEKRDSRKELSALIIKEGVDRESDLFGGIYKVFNGGKFVSVPFSISSNEDSLIKHFFFTERIDKLKRSAPFLDNCNQLPKVYTKIVFKVDDQMDSLSIDMDCDLGQKNVEGLGVIRFLRSVDSILKRKEEIKNAPLSTYMYQ